MRNRGAALPSLMIPSIFLAHRAGPTWALHHLFNLGHSKKNQGQKTGMKSFEYVHFFHSFYSQVFLNVF